MFKASLLAALLCGSAVADGTLPGAPIPGQKVVQIPRENPQGLTNLIQDIEAITGEDTVQVANSAPSLYIYTLKWPVPITENDENAVEAVFGDAQTDGDIIQRQDNYIIDATNGQTGSLWVSGPGIDQAAYSDNQYAIEQIELAQTHETFSRGAGTLVAIIDTGIDPTHEALSGYVSANGTNTIVEGGETNDSAQGDYAGHGTFVAGLVHLVAPDSLLLPITVLKGDGSGFPVDVADGISSATQRGAHVIVLALGSEISHFAIEEAIDEAISNGATIVAAVGNHLPEGTNNCLFPANYNGLLAGHTGVIAVGACNESNHHSPFSNYHLEVNVCAPGESFQESGSGPNAFRSVVGPLPGGSYAAGNGTSFSTGFAGGVAALIRAQQIDWPNNTVPTETISMEIMERIENSTTVVRMPVQFPDDGWVEDKPALNAYQATETGPVLVRTGDLDGDGKVDGRDLSILLGSWGPLPTNGALHNADLLRDELVDGGDLAVLLGNWGVNAP